MNNTEITQYKDSTALGRFNKVLFAPAMQMYINDVLRDKSSPFISNIASMFNSNPTLHECDPSSIIFAGLKATELNLPLNSELGYA
jgi:recombination protein RecT